MISSASPHMLLVAASGLPICAFPAALRGLAVARLERVDGCAPLTLTLVVGAFVLTLAHVRRSLREDVEEREPSFAPQQEQRGSPNLEPETKWN